MDREKELREAVEAADEALAHLSRAERLLRTSGRWGCLSTLGGGVIVSLLRHSEMQDARREAEAAREAVRAFGRELKDVAFLMDSDLDAGDLLSTAEPFADGSWANTLLEARAEEAQARTQEAISRIRAIRDGLLRELDRT